VVEGIRRGAESLSCVMFNCVVVDTCKRAVLKCLERRGLTIFPLTSHALARILSMKKSPCLLLSSLMSQKAVVSDKVVHKQAYSKVSE
jgi:hypothetical protein